MAPRSDPLGLTVLLGMLIALTALAIDSALPVLPELALALAGDATAAQFTLTALFAGIAMGQLLWGPLSDRHGRRPVLLAALALACIAGGGCAAVSSLPALAVLRFAQGFAVSAGPVLSRTVVRDLYSHERAAQLLARAMIVFGVAPIVGPLAGSLLLQAFGWRAVFVLHAAIAAVLLLAVARGLKETAPAERTPVPMHRIAAMFGQLLRERRFLAPYLVLISAQSGIMAWILGSAFALVRGMGLGPGVYALLFSFMMLGQIAGAYASSRLVMGRGIAAMLRIGTRLACAAGTAMLLLDLAGMRHWSAVIAPMFVYLFAASFIVPHATAAALSHLTQRVGTASSLMGALQFTLGALLGALLGAAFDGSARPMILAIALSGFATLLFERFLFRSLPAHP